MLFDSPVYFVFLIAIVLAYWRLSHQAQNTLLLVASYFFYGWWDWRFLALMIGSTTMDFVIAQKIALGRSRPNRKKWFIFSLALNFGILGVFKYFNFFVDSFSSALSIVGIHYVPIALIRIILPPGISFYTFQEVAYIVELYKGRLEPAKSFVDYSLFISLFPHLIAGPIQRPAHLLPQVQKDRTLDPDRFFDGMMLIFSGLLRKCVVADNCALLVDAAFGGQLGPPNVWVVLIGTYGFAWQVYGDFSGYSDIARGSAQLLGFHFMVNFRQPFLAQRLQEFWRRWHISLSTWLRDYLYIPLGGNRNGTTRTYVNLMLTMLLGGLWYGASWNFVFWGGLHGVSLGIHRAWTAWDPLASLMARPAFRLVWSLFSRLLTLGVVLLGWIFFRAESWAAASQYMRRLVTWSPEGTHLVSPYILPAGAAVVLVHILVQKDRQWTQELPDRALSFRILVYSCLTLLLACFAATASAPFIYFQF